MDMAASIRELLCNLISPALWDARLGALIIAHVVALLHVVAALGGAVGATLQAA